MQVPEAHVDPGSQTTLASHALPTVANSVERAPVRLSAHRYSGAQGSSPSQPSNQKHRIAAGSALHAPPLVQYGASAPHVPAPHGRAQRSVAGSQTPRPSQALVPGSQGAPSATAAPHLPSSRQRAPLAHTDPASMLTAHGWPARGRSWTAMQSPSAHTAPSGHESQSFVLVQPRTHAWLASSQCRPSAQGTCAHELPSLPKPTHVAPQLDPATQSP